MRDEEELELYYWDERNEMLTMLLQVTYFKKWRVQDIKKKQMLAELEAKGAAKMDVNTEFKSR